MSRRAARLMQLAARLLRNRQFTIRTGLARGMRRRFGFGFRPGFGRELDPEELFLEGLDLAGKTIFDIGAYVGMHTLFFARAAGESGRVVSFEPNPTNAEELRFNIGLNALDTVEIVQVAIGETAGELTFTYDPVYPARGTLDEQTAARLTGSRTTRVAVAPLDAVVAERGLADPDLIKVDVEGLEEAVVRGMQETLARCRPALFIELHRGGCTSWLLENLIGHGYALHHVEGDTDIGASDAGLLGHLYCEVRPDSPDAEEGQGPPRVKTRA